MTSTKRVMRIRQRQQQIDADVMAMLKELGAMASEISCLLGELDEAKSPRPGVTSMVSELKPQVDRWQSVVQGVINRQAVL